MRMSCNGCRVLRKGCNEKCSIRPCLQWIKSPEAQGNATVFLAKFYGRAGLINLINAGPDDDSRPGIFRSLLYEACGRIVNPVYGATGLLWSGNWHLCQAAVEAVLNGSPISPASADSAACTVSPPLKACDIRHVPKDSSSAGSAAAAAGRDLHKVRKSKGKFKRASAATVGDKSKSKAAAAGSIVDVDDVDEAARVMWGWSHKEAVRSPSRDSGLSQHVEEEGGRSRAGDSGDADTDSGSGETVEAELANSKPEESAEGSEVELELTLGLEPRQWKAGPELRMD
ncbi:OLC1v1014206C1 [Oldenlandia corymbosa var. corymbosa]|uniref:OLC1v1014206C1 n=1 Tax=Oldenlandia corymbosa var. corymbosa TaxID=529605 RepID=A0AAV1E3L3_OLDCO|nr:OLC1v1014206C1 [Oldenlandia corymbosa var. corymbosa]